MFDLFGISATFDFYGGCVVLCGYEDMVALT